MSFSGVKLTVTVDWHIHIQLHNLKCNKTHWRVYVECVLLMAGLQPHLAWVRLIGLWLGGAAHLWCMSNHGTQDKPVINTHTRRSHSHDSLYHQLANYHLPETPNKYLVQHLPCPVSEGPKGSHLSGVWKEQPCHIHDRRHGYEPPWSFSIADPTRRASGPDTAPFRGSVPKAGYSADLLCVIYVVT